MLLEAISYLTGIVRDSHEPIQFEIPGLPTKSFVAIGGEIAEKEHEPPARKHECHSLASLMDWAGVGENTVWYCNEGVRVILHDQDDNLRRDQVYLPLTPSAEMLSATKGIHGATQQKFVRWVLDNLDRNIEEASPGFLQTVRQVKFSQNQTGEGTVANGKESFGNAIAAEVAGKSSFPDDITVSVLVWAELDIRVDVRMAFVVNPHESTFSLRCLDASKQRAGRESLSSLELLLLEGVGDSRLFCGKY